ncbi:hypothetical protein ACHWQZ_G017560 [Mnemiopsis leidyi]
MGILHQESLERRVSLSLAAVCGVALYLFVALCVSTLGNIIVLCYIRQHKISRVGKTVRRLLYYLALTDLLINPTATLPMFITTIARKWVLGKLFCICVALLQAWIMLMEIWIVTMIAIQKFYTVIFPLRSLISKQGTKFVTIFLVIWCLVPILLVVIGYSHVSFYPESLTCCIEYTPAAHGNGTLAVVTACVYTLLPLSVVTCLYVVILKEAKEYSRRRAAGVPFWRAPLTVSIVVGLFIISVGPGVVTSIVGNLKGGGHLIHPTVWTVQCTSSLLNTLCNPVVYIVTNKNFMEYCRNKTLSSKTSPLIPAVSPEIDNRAARKSIVELNVKSSKRNQALESPSNRCQDAGSPGNRCQGAGSPGMNHSQGVGSPSNRCQGAGSPSNRCQVQDELPRRRGKGDKVAEKTPSQESLTDQKIQEGRPKLLRNHTLSASSKGPALTLDFFELHSV